MASRAASALAPRPGRRSRRRGGPSPARASTRASSERPRAEAAGGSSPTRAGPCTRCRGLTGTDPLQRRLRVRRRLVHDRSRRGPVDRLRPGRSGAQSSKNGAGGAEVDDLGVADAPSARPSSRGCGRRPRAAAACRSIAVGHRRAAEVIAVLEPGRRGPAAASGRSARRRPGSARVRAAASLVGEVEAPIPGRDRDAAAEPEEGDALDLACLAVQHRAAGQPAAASRSASSVSLLPGTSTVGVSIPASASIVSVEAVVDRGEVAGADHDVGIGAQLDELGGLVEVAVQVGEGEEFQTPTTVSQYPGRCSSSILIPSGSARKVA